MWKQNIFDLSDSLDLSKEVLYNKNTVNTHKEVQRDNW